MELEYTCQGETRVRDVESLVDSSVFAAEGSYSGPSERTDERLSELRDIVGWLVNLCAEAGIITPEQVGERLCHRGADFRRAPGDR